MDPAPAGIDLLKELISYIENAKEYIAVISPDSVQGINEVHLSIYKKEFIARTINDGFVGALNQVFRFSLDKLGLIALTIRLPNSLIYCRHKESATFASIPLSQLQSFIDMNNVRYEYLADSDTDTDGEAKATEPSRLEIQEIEHLDQFTQMNDALIRFGQHLNLPILNLFAANSLWASLRMPLKERIAYLEQELLSANKTIQAYEAEMSKARDAQFPPLSSPKARKSASSTSRLMPEDPISILKTQMTILNAEITTLKESIRVLKEKNNNLQIQIQGLEKRNKRLQEHIRGNEKTAQKNAAQITLLETQLATEEQKVSILQAEKQQDHIQLSARCLELHQLEAFLNTPFQKPALIPNTHTLKHLPHDSLHFSTVILLNLDRLSLSRDNISLFHFSPTLCGSRAIKTATNPKTDYDYALYIHTSTHCIEWVRDNLHAIFPNPTTCTQTAKHTQDDTGIIVVSFQVMDSRQNKHDFSFYLSDRHSIASVEEITKTSRLLTHKTASICLPKSPHFRSYIPLENTKHHIDPETGYELLVPYSALTPKNIAYIFSEIARPDSSEKPSQHVLDTLYFKLKHYCTQPSLLTELQKELQKYIIAEEGKKQKLRSADPTYLFSLIEQKRKPTAITSSAVEGAFTSTLAAGAASPSRTPSPTGSTDSGSTTSQSPDTDARPEGHELPQTPAAHSPTTPPVSDLLPDPSH